MFASDNISTCVSHVFSFYLDKVQYRFCSMFVLVAKVDTLGTLLENDAA